VVISQPANLAFQDNKNFVLGYAQYSQEDKKEFSKIDDPSELLIQADELSAKAENAKQEFYFENGKVKTCLSDNKEDLKHSADIRRLAAAELTAYNNRIEFMLMKRSFLETLGHYNNNDTTVIRAKNILLKAIRTNRSARELREEAYAQQSTGAILGNLQNAEELENSSMIKMVQAIELLDKIAPQDISAK
jgi:hypothetical protein